MTSKEALKRLWQETAPATYMKDFDKKECCDAIERDLEVLKWIKNNASPEIKEYADGTKTLVLYDDCTEDKIEICLPIRLWDKVKEWLKEEHHGE